MAIALTFLGLLRSDGGVNVVLSGAAPHAGVVWSVAAGAGTLSAAEGRADAAGIASVRYIAADVIGDTVTIEAAVYGP